MTTAAVDLEKLRVALHRMSRDNLLTLAERAIDLVPRAKLQELLADFVRLDDFAKTKAGAAPLLAEVQRFHAASMHGDYYDSFGVNSRNFMDKSEGTEEFIADFDRLLGKCVRATERGPQAPVREAFELLFGLLRRIDEGHDDVIFFADEAGSWQVGVDWRAALPAYFRSLAGTASPEEFARGVDRAIKDFSKRERPRFLTAARRVASAEQKAALRALLSGTLPGADERCEAPTVSLERSGAALGRGRRLAGLRLFAFVRAEQNLACFRPGDSRRPAWRPCETVGKTRKSLILH
jgi:hypothetical protein